MDGLTKKRPEEKEPTSPVNRKKRKESDTPSSSMNHNNSNNTVATDDLCVYCFDVIIAHHLRGKVEKPSPNFENESYPLFVTWTTGKSHKLRGCIGTFSSLPLHKGVKEYALTSALNDTRFDPISKEEIPNLNVKVSLLVGFENGKDYLDWNVGEHGIKISVENGRSTRTATYLPEVASESGWTKEQTIEALLHKAGIRQPPTQKLKDSIKLVRYRSEVVSMTYEEYVKTKGNVPHLNGE